MLRRQTDTILVSVLIKTLVLFVSLGPYLLSRATHLCLFPALTLCCLRMFKVQASGRGRVRAPGPSGCPRVSFTLRVSVSLRLRLCPASPQTSDETGIWSSLYFTGISFSSKCMDCHYQNRVLLASKSCQFQMNYLNEIAYLLALKCYKNWQWSFSNTW